MPGDRPGKQKNKLKSVDILSRYAEKTFSRIFADSVPNPSGELFCPQNAESFCRTNAESFSAINAPAPREADAARARGKLGIGGEHLPVAYIC